MTREQDKSRAGRAKEEYIIRPIGYVSCSHIEQEKTPIQPVYGAGSRARVIVFPEYEEGLDDLVGFSHIYIVFVFHKAGPPDLKVKPYFDNVKRGLFATRSPRRPNPIGFSLVRLIRREKNVLFIEDDDILNGSPVVDIKPFIPRLDSRPDARSGWLENITDSDAGEIGSRMKKEPDK